MADAVVVEEGPEGQISARGPALPPGGTPNLIAALYESADSLGDSVAVSSADGSETMSWRELCDRASRIAGGLADVGIERGDTVALMLNNRPEFMPCDLGAVMLGAVPFSIYQTSSIEQIKYLIEDASSKVVICEEAFRERVEEACSGLDSVEVLVSVDGGGGDERLMSLEELERRSPSFDGRTAAETIDPDDLLTLIYTSGTTGPPKGVQLTHRNLMTLVGGIEGIVPLPQGEAEVISWLPAAHIAERGAHYYLPIVSGVKVTICPDPREIVQFLPKVRPTWFFAVPRVWEKLKAGLEAMLAGLPDEAKEKAEAGLEASIARVRAEQAGEEVPAAVAEAAAQADEQLFSGLRKQLGLDRLSAVNVGAAPTPVEVLEFFHAIGIPIGELWGMSETCGVATCNPPGEVKLGTVGPPVPGVEIKLDGDGEVLVRADSVMPGYRNLPEKTAECLEDGWLRTGDIGEIDSDGYLRIVDRKKELIINAAGKNMSPANIEAHLKAASPLVGQAIAIGDARPYNVALVVLDPDFAPVWAAQNGMEGASISEIAASAEAAEAIEQAVAAANEHLSRVEQIKKFAILPVDWLPGGDELTPTMKLKRKPIHEKYAEEIEALYAG